jgi:tetratricopeptide (TPR) repeat protein
MAVTERAAPTVAKESPDVERQLVELRREAALHPDDPDQQLAFAMLATKVGEYADALEAYRRALELRKRQKEFVWIFMGIAATRTGHHEDALEAFSHVAEAAPTDPSAWVFKAMALENLGRLAESQDALERAATLEPKDAKEMVMVGFALGGLERYHEALAMDDRAIKADPTNATAWANRGTHLIACGRDNADAATTAFETALARAEDDPKVLPTILRNYGIALVELDRPAEALPQLERARDLDPDDFTIRRSLGVVYTRLDEHEQALEHDRETIKLAPHHPVAWRSLGLDLFELERYEEALFAFTKAADLAPDHAQMWQAKGLALWRLGRYSEALAAFERATKLDGEYADGWLAKGACLDAVGRHEEAVEALRNAVGLTLTDAQPERSELWALLGIAYGHVGDARAAEHAFLSGYRVDATEAMASGVIDSRARQRREQDALDFLATAKPRGADEGLVAYWRAILRWRAGEESLAADELRNAVRAWKAVGAEHDRAKAASRALEAFEGGHGGAASWNEYWFRAPRFSLNTMLGAILLIALLATIAVPPAYPGAVDGGQRWAEFILAATVLLVLLALPTVRKIKAGGGSFEIETIVLVEQEHRELALSTEIGIEKIPDLPGLAPTTIPAFAELVEEELGQLGEVDLHALREKPAVGKERPK